MFAIVLKMAKFAWGWLLPIVGKAWRWALPVLAPWTGALKAALPVLVSVAVIAAAAGAWWLLTPSGGLTAQQCKQECEAANLKAELEATKDALRIAAETLRLRGILIEETEKEIHELREELEKLREVAPDPDVVVFAADDPWLRARRPH